MHIQRTLLIAIMLASISCTPHQAAAAVDAATATPAAAAEFIDMYGKFGPSGDIYRWVSGKEYALAASDGTTVHPKPHELRPPNLYPVVVDDEVARLRRFFLGRTIYPIGPSGYGDSWCNYGSLLQQRPDGFVGPVVATHII